MMWPWRRRRTAFAPGQEARLAALRARARAAVDVPPWDADWIVADVESTGLDVSRDRLIAIGAVRVTAGRIALASAFHTVLRQDQASDTANILVHRITDSEQLGGIDPVEVLLRFHEFAAGASLAGFHSPFDAAMIGRAERAYLGRELRAPWIDLADLVPALGLAPSGERADLDALFAAHGIAVYERHDALADAVATAQLLLVCLAAARTRKVASVRALHALADGERWLRQRR